MWGGCRDGLLWRAGAGLGRGDSRRRRACEGWDGLLWRAGAGTGLIGRETAPYDMWGGGNDAGWVAAGGRQGGLLLSQRGESPLPAKLRAKFACAPGAAPAPPPPLPAGTAPRPLCSSCSSWCQPTRRSGGPLGLGLGQAPGRPARLAASGRAGHPWPRRPHAPLAPHFAHPTHCVHTLPCPPPPHTHTHTCTHSPPTHTPPSLPFPQPDDGVDCAAEPHDRVARHAVRSVARGPCRYRALLLHQPLRVSGDQRKLGRNRAGTLAHDVVPSMLSMPAHPSIQPATAAAAARPCHTPKQPSSPSPSPSDPCHGRRCLCCRPGPQVDAGRRPRGGRCSQQEVQAHPAHRQGQLDREAERGHHPRAAGPEADHALLPGAQLLRGGGLVGVWCVFEGACVCVCVCIWWWWWGCGGRVSEQGQHVGWAWMVACMHVCVCPCGVCFGGRCCTQPPGQQWRACDVIGQLPWCLERATPCPPSPAQPQAHAPTHPAYPPRPALPLPCASHPLYQVDVDITSNTVANSVTSLVVGAITSLVVDLAPLVEGQVCACGGGGGHPACCRGVQGRAARLQRLPLVPAPLLPSALRPVPSISVSIFSPPSNMLPPSRRPRTSCPSG